MELIPTKQLLLSLTREANVPKQYIIDSIAKTSGCSVLRLPPFHGMLKPIEMVWSQMKQHCRQQNIYTKELPKMLDLICKVWSTKISLKNLESFVSHIIKEEKFRKTEQIVDTEIESVKSNWICSSSENDSDSDVEQ